TDLRRCARSQRPTLADSAVPLPPLAEERAGSHASAERVVRQADLEAFLALLREQIGEPLADVARSVDEGLDMNIVARRAQCGLDGRVGLRPVDQDVDAIAGRERRG